MRLAPTSIPTLARDHPASDVARCQTSAPWLGTTVQRPERLLKVEQLQRDLEVEPVGGGREVDAQQLLDPGRPVAPGVGVQAEPSGRGLDAEVARRQGAQEAGPAGAVLAVVGEEGT